MHTMALLMTLMLGPATGPTKTLTETCSERCVGEVTSVYHFPRGTRRESEPEGTDHPEGWDMTFRAPGGVATAVFDRGVRARVTRTLFCRPWTSPTPVAMCSATRIVATADLFLDGFESGDTSEWSSTRGRR